jgi:hypothetical protein
MPIMHTKFQFQIIKTPFFGELFHLIFRVLYDNSSKIIGDEFLIFEETSICTSFFKKNIPFSNKTKIYEEFNMRYYMEKLCKIDNISIF